MSIGRDIRKLTSTPPNTTEHRGVDDTAERHGDAAECHGPRTNLPAHRGGVIWGSLDRAAPWTGAAVETRRVLSSSLSAIGQQATHFLVDEPVHKVRSVALLSVLCSGEVRDEMDTSNKVLDVDHNEPRGRVVDEHSPMPNAVEEVWTVVSTECGESKCLALERHLEQELETADAQSRARNSTRIMGVAIEHAVATEVAVKSVIDVECGRGCSPVRSGSLKKCKAR